MHTTKRKKTLHVTWSRKDSVCRKQNVSFELLRVFTLGVLLEEGGEVVNGGHLLRVVVHPHHVDAPQEGRPVAQLRRRRHLHAREKKTIHEQKTTSLT